jgi:hypothetical protein
MIIDYNNFTDSDICVLKWQLRSNEARVCSIVERCYHGFPRIIMLSPVKSDSTEKQINHESLSNVLWLTCPYLNEKIHNIEDMGYITKISGIIADYQALKEKMAVAHSHFYYLRKRLYRDFYKDLYPEKMIGLFNTGIGGVRDTSSLKCLHMHFSHYRINENNIAGYITQQVLSNTIDCRDKKCAHVE